MRKDTCFTTTVDLSLAERLKSDLEAQGFTFSSPPYTVFSAKKKGVSCTLYASGKLMVQGKEIAEFIEFYLEPQILSSLAFSHPETLANLESHIGMDEAGKGDVFGPLVVAAVYADEKGIGELIKLGVRDSKRLQDSSILKLAKTIRENFAFTTIRLFPKKYNELYARFKNLNRLLAWAHTAALADLHEKTHCSKATLDKFADESVVLSFLHQKKLHIQLTQQTKAESDVVVAAASIVARAGFVEGMDKLSEEIGCTLPKGANHGVNQTLQHIVSTHGKQALEMCAKLHFKTVAVFFP